MYVHIVSSLTQSTTAHTHTHCKEYVFGMFEVRSAWFVFYSRSSTRDALHPFAWWGYPQGTKAPGSADLWRKDQPVRSICWETLFVPRMMDSLIDESSRLVFLPTLFYSAFKCWIENEKAKARHWVKIWCQSLPLPMTKILCKTWPSLSFCFFLTGLIHWVVAMKRSNWIIFFSSRRLISFNDSIWLHWVFDIDERTFGCAQVSIIL